MRDGRSILVSLALVSLLLLDTFSHATPVPVDVEHVASETFIGDAWASFRVTLPAHGGHVETKLTGVSSSGLDRFALGQWVSLPDGTLEGASTSIVTAGGLYDVRADVLDPPIVSLSKIDESEAFSEVEVTTYFALPAGEHIIVLASAWSDDAISGAYSLYATDGTINGGSSQGMGVFLYEDTDFSGVAQARLRLGPARAIGAVLSEAHVAIENSMYANFQFWRSLNQPGLLRYTDPEGNSHADTCCLTVTAGPRGIYDFAIDLALAADISSLRVTIIGADVALSEPLIV